MDRHDSAGIRDVPVGILALLVANFFHTVAFVGMFTFVGDAVYEITGDTLDLAWLGLALFVPVFLFSPLAGTVADRFDRRAVYGTAILPEIALAAALYFYIRSDPEAVWPIFMIMALFGLARAFAAPPSRAMPIDLAPPAVLETVIALKSAFFQTGVIVGPVAASFAAARSRELPYLLAIGALTITLTLLILAVPKPPIKQLDTPPGMLQAFRDAGEGVRYMRRNPILFGAITLDLFAVLLGGAIALLPAIAADRLNVGEIGLGWLRAADGIGAAVVSLLLAWRPLRRRIGKILFIVVGIFGVATIVLGVTTSYVVAFGAIVVLSAADAVSVYIRSSIVPLATPEVMRGRVLAVENVFIGGSNELGAVESGAAGRLLGVSWAIITGGIGTLAVVAIWWRLFPALRDIDTFNDVRIDEPAEDFLF